MRKKNTFGCISTTPPSDREEPRRGYVEGKISSGKVGPRLYGVNGQFLLDLTASSSLDVKNAL